jgi:hypothetical protein
LSKSYQVRISRFLEGGVQKQLTIPVTKAAAISKMLSLARDWSLLEPNIVFIFHPYILV